MYGVEFDGTNSNLYSVNRTTGATAFVGSCGPGLLINLAINNSGQAFAVEIGTDVFGTINLTTGAFTSIGSIGFDANYAQDMEFDRESGELYIAACDASLGWLAWVNQTTGATEKIGDFEGGAEVTGLAIPYAMTEAKLYDVSIFLEGAYTTISGVMNTSLNSVMPLSHPYSTSPWNYSGTEQVGSIPAGVVDWVLVELRQAADPASATSATTLAKRAAFLKSNGTIVDLDGTSLLSMSTPTITNNLYVVIHHRNHLAVMSANGAVLNSGVYSYDFTTGLAQAYRGGTGYKLAGSKAVMVVGDIDHDGNIFVSDYNSWATGFGATNGYFMTDLDMDRDVFVSDYNKWAVNFGSTFGGSLKSILTKPKYFSCVPK